MIIKAKTPDGGWRLFDNIKSSIKYTDPHTFLPVPPNTVDTPADLEAFIESHVSGEYELNPLIKSDKEVPRPVTEVVMGYRADDMPDERRIYFMGETAVNYPIEDVTIKYGERFSFKLVCFMRERIEYWIYTELPVYICSDKGDTIERIK